MLQNEPRVSSGKLWQLWVAKECYTELMFFFLLISLRYAKNTGAKEAKRLSRKGRLCLMRTQGERRTMPLRFPLIMY